jgi:hypothetical protein
MSTEPKTEAEKGPFRVPALVTLVPKRRFKTNLPAEEETVDLNEESLRPPDRQKPKRSGRVILRRTSEASSFAQVAPAPPKARPYAP